MLCVDFNYEDCCGGVVHLDGGGGSLAEQLVGIGVVVDIGEAVCDLHCRCIA